MNQRTVLRSSALKNRAQLDGNRQYLDETRLAQNVPASKTFQLRYVLFLIAIPAFGGTRSDLTYSLNSPIALLVLIGIALIAAVSCLRAQSRQDAKEREEMRRAALQAHETMSQRTVIFGGRR